jgi:AhpD family alkylhydroperoxidase
LRLLDKILYYKVAPGQIRYLTSIDYSAATGLARDVMLQMESDFLVGPPLTVHLPNPPLLAGVWSLCRECLAADRIPRPMGDLIAGVVSRANTCPYCFGIHTAMLHSFGVGEDADVLQNNQAFTDPAKQRIAAWAAATLMPTSEILQRPPFTREQAPQVIGTALAFHYLNRIVNVFLDPIPLSDVSWLKGAFTRMSGRMMRTRLSAQHLAPAGFLNAEPDIRLPPQFEWAAPDANIAGAVRRFVTAAEEAGRQSVDPRVRERVVAHVQSWNGESPGVSRAWIEPAVSSLDENLRPAARLALLTALASYQVDEGIVKSFQARQPGDRHLINLTSWASYTAVCRLSRRPARISTRKWNTITPTAKA